MLRARTISIAVAICLILTASAAIAQRPRPVSGDFSLDVGFAALTGKDTQDWFGSGGYNIGAEYRTSRGHGDEQTISLSYLKSSGQTLNVGGTPTDSWLSGFTVGTTYRKRPTFENKLYYGYGGGLSLMTEKSSAAGVTTSRNTDPSPEVHALVGLAISDYVRLEAGYTQFIRSVHNPGTGESAGAGGAFTFAIGGRF